MCSTTAHGILLLLKIPPVGEKLRWEKFNVNDDDFPLFLRAGCTQKKFFIFTSKTVGVLTSEEEHCFTEMKIHIIPLNEQSLMLALKASMFVSAKEEKEFAFLIRSCRVAFET